MSSMARFARLASTFAPRAEIPVARSVAATAEIAAVRASTQTQAGLTPVQFSSTHLDILAQPELEVMDILPAGRWGRK